MASTEMKYVLQCGNAKSVALRTLAAIMRERRAAYAANAACVESSRYLMKREAEPARYISRMIGSTLAPLGR